MRALARLAGAEAGRRASGLTRAENTRTVMSDEAVRTTSFDGNCRSEENKVKHESLSIRTDEPRANCVLTHARALMSPT